jgi:ABC-type uncharacterized transport system fused permease/ATPase subunit
MGEFTSVPLDAIGKEELSKTGRQLWQITKAFYVSERRKARTLLILLLTLSVAYVGVTVLMSYASRDLFTAIEQKDTHTYWIAIGWYLGTFVFVSVSMLFEGLSRDFEQIW